MDSKIISLFGLAVGLLSTPLAFSGTMGAEPQGFHVVVTGFGGVAGAYVNSGTQSFVGTDGEVFLYDTQYNNQAIGFGGGFLGIEHRLFQYDGLFYQFGVEYDYFSNINTSGLNTVGIENATVTMYNYAWQLQVQQVLAVGKIYATVESTLFNHQAFFPYFSVGLGGAFSNAKNFSAVALQPPGVNITPTYSNDTQSYFSYNLGLGVDAPVYQNFRVGLGYRFSDFGNSSLGVGQVAINQYIVPTTFTLRASHTYANQFLAQISYVA